MCCGYQRGCSTKVDCHGIAYQVCGYQQSFLMQFLAMTKFLVRVLKIIPVGLFVVMSSGCWVGRQDWLDAVYMQSLRRKIRDCNAQQHN